MEPLYKSAVVGLVPQPTQVPPAPFRREDLQRVFVDITRDYEYQQFGFLPGDAGAQLANGPEDTVMIQPALLQIQAKIDLTTEATREKIISVYRAVTSRLAIGAFLQVGIKVIAHVPAPGQNPDAKAFVTERLMRGADPEAELGPGFFGGGVKYRRIDEPGGREENLLIEPFVRDNAFVFIDYDVGRAPTQRPFDNLDDVSTWLDEAFSFVGREAMGLLEG